jgi:cytochrome c biogenesis protein CcmG/thiol:disulfide interchange protein DsbE
MTASRAHTGSADAATATTESLNHNMRCYDTMYDARRDRPAAADEDPTGGQIESSCHGMWVPGHDSPPERVPGADWDRADTTPVADPASGTGPRDEEGRRLRRVLAFAVIPLLFVGFLVYGLLRTRAPRAGVGSVAPSFRLPVLGGGTLSNEQLMGKPVVVNFWASWCRPCREEAPTLERAWEQYRSRGVQLLGVNVQDSPEDAMAFTKEFRITYPSVRDTDLRLWTDFGVRGVPETFFLDHTWRFLAVGSGPQIGSQGATKVLGAISPVELGSQIELLLERRAEAGRGQPRSSGQPGRGRFPATGVGGRALGDGLDEG